MLVPLRRCLIAIVLACLPAPLAFGQEAAVAAPAPESATTAATVAADAPVRTDVTTADFVRVVDQVAEFAARHTAAGVLLVVDIDNTLLAMNQHLGSDQWFTWQDGLLKSDPDSPHLVAEDFPGLLEVQGTLFALSGMHPPEPDLPEHIKAIQDMGVTTVVLTSRSDDFRNAAQRELARNGYDFAKSALRIDERRGVFLPFDPALPDAHGLSADIIETIKDRLSPVSYSGGIYMTAGQHKGHMLQTLLARAIPDDGARHESRTFRAVVFVDDHQKHTQRVHDALADSPMDLATIRYSREDGNVAAFEASDKRQEVNGWRRLQRAIDTVLMQ